MRVLVCTVVHHTTDARIFRREIGALRGAGIEVDVVAPYAASDLTDPGYRRFAIPRAVGRRRWAAWRAARARVSALAVEARVVLVHDPELLLVLPWRELRRMRAVVVWDVHEDLAAALANKAYLPPVVRRILVPLVHAVEHWVERRAVLLLAETAYQQRFSRQHDVVLNLPLVADSMPAGERLRQAIYVGSITRARGLDEMLAMAPLLAAHGIALRLIGEAPSTADAERIRATPNVRWDGALPNAAAMREVEASMVGLALLHDLPNYRHSMPTKILEYMASGTAVVATPLPLSRQVVGQDGIVLSTFPGPRDAAPPTAGPQTAVVFAQEAAGPQTAVVFAQEAADAVIALCDDPVLRERATRTAFERVRADYNWHTAQHAFVRAITEATPRR